MVMAIALTVIVIGSVLFQLLSPWWTTPIASNWQQMDHTLTITVVICGLFFIAINLFVVYTVWKFRHREGQRAAYQPDNPKLEKWLIGLTTVGVAALLAPGLVVYADYVSPPKDAMIVEVVGQQWQWRYRFAGPEGKLGASDARFVSGANPFGLDPDDPAARDNIVVAGNEIHLPINKPVKMILRSHDVLHDFFVPEFRARMNIVPGQISTFWFTPTKAGRYEAMCAQLCGVGHPNMRGTVVVEDEAAYAGWLKTQLTFAAARSGSVPAAAGGADSLEGKGRALAQSKGCAACHSVDGAPGAGPTWKGLYGKTEAFADGTSQAVDESVLKREITEPTAKVVKGFAQIMPKIPLANDELEAIVAYIKSQGAAAPSAPKAQR